MSIPATTEELLKRWHKRLRELQFSQYEAARILSIWYYAIGIGATIITGFVGSNVFTSIKNELSADDKIKLGFLALCGTLLVALQTFLKLNNRAEKHKTAGAKAAKLRRKIEQLIVGGHLDTLSESTLNNIRTTYDSVSSEAPEVSKFTYDRVVKKLEKD